MKSIAIKAVFIWVLILIFPFVISSCKTQFKKLSTGKTDTIKIEIATNFVISYFNTLENGNTFDFENIAVKAFYDSMKPTFQKQTYEKVEQQFGQLLSVKYAATWVNKSTPQFEIIRLVGQFEKNRSPLEIRVIVNKDNKISGFWIKPWRNNLNNY